MIVTIQSPEYLPELGYFVRIAAADLHIILDSAKLPRRDAVSRTNLLGPDGPAMLTVPVERSGHTGQRIHEARLDFNKKWQKKQLQQIYHYYTGAPYFDDVFPVIKKYVKKRYIYLANMNIDLVEVILSMVRIPHRYIRASEMNVTGTGTFKLIRLVQEVEGRTVILPDYAREFVDVPLFKKNGLDVVFHTYSCPEYEQYRDGFVPGLSTADALFNTGRQAVYGFCMDGKNDKAAFTPGE